VIHLAWMVPALPALSFFLILFFGKRTPGRGADIGIAFTLVSLVLSCIILAQFAHSGETARASLPLLDVGGLKLEFGQNVDGLAAVMFVIICLVSLCSQVYSTAYMQGDRRYTIYYAWLSLFTASMLNLVIADNLFQLLVGWELVGICSYLLIGHWWEEKENSDAAIKAFITTKTGDVPFLFGIFVLTVAAGTANIPDITAKIAGGGIPTGILTVSALLLFGGAIGKSAQFPLQVWLPDAMAGPTPVSALIHAATMVVAGVYLVARMFAVYAPSGHALAFVGTIGAITMLGAALVALVQDDIKRVLAYSTISQLAYMVAALGLGPQGYTPGLFHLFTHAFFKALLFYGAGSVIHACHTNNMSEMGGLRKYMPVTFATFGIGTLALVGIPPFAGFFSKDEIIATAFHTHHYAIWLVALATAFVTALYMTRAIVLTFAGDYRGAGHPHESPPAMTAPMALLAALSVGAGFMTGLFGDWVRFPGAEGEAFSVGLAVLSVAVVLAGIGLGWRLYGRASERDPLLSLGWFSRLLTKKYYMDDLYTNDVVRPIQYPVANMVNTFDRGVIDGAVNGVGRETQLAGRFLRYVQSGDVQRYAVYLFVGVAVLAVVITRLGG
jgi:NADH-quinone oxidoreductase subunit L